MVSVVITSSHGYTNCHGKARKRNQSVHIENEKTVFIENRYFTPKPMKINDHIRID